jgi:hypothetical protein
MSKYFASASSADVAVMARCLFLLVETSGDYEADLCGFQALCLAPGEAQSMEGGCFNNYNIKDVLLYDSAGVVLQTASSIEISHRRIVLKWFKMSGARVELL